MSSHFSANQYETAFSSQRLQNYQVPAQHKEHPSLRKGCTKVIVNDRGHLNTDVNRSPSSPWGSFVGTWQMERKPIQLKTKTRLTANLYRGYTPGSRQSSRASSAKSGELNREIERLMSPKGSLPQTPQNGSRPNTVGSDSSWVIIDTLPSNEQSPAVSVRPASQEKEVTKESPLPQGSRVQSAVTSSRTPTPAGSIRSGSAARSTGLPPAVDEATVSQGVSPSGSQKTISRPHSRRSDVRENQTPLQSGTPNKSSASSPCLLTQTQ